MQNREFRVEKDDDGWSSGCEKLTLRNRYIKWNLAREGIPEDLPNGTWIVTLERNSAILPGLLLREA